MWHKSHRKAKAYQSNASHMSTCQTTEVNDHPASMWVTHGPVTMPIIAGSLDWNYCYKLAINQIPYDPV